MTPASESDVANKMAATMNLKEFGRAPQLRG
jgi:hypothetical protein